jgi:hypothetical protein
MVLESSVIDAPRANTPPLIVEPPFIVTDTAARMFPIKPVPIPIVALLPTFQKTVPEDPPVIITDAATVVVTVLPIWKYHASLQSPVPASVRTPVN